MTPKPIADRVAEEARAIRRLARALLRDDARAADLSQDVMLAGLQGEPPPGTRLRAWLTGVTRNLAMRQRRDEQLRRRHEGAAARAERLEDLTAQRLELHERMGRALRGLPEPYRTVVTLRFFEGLAPREIARRVGRSPEAVRQQVRRGLEMLRRELDGEYGERGAWAGLLVGWGATNSVVGAGIVGVFMNGKKMAAAAAVVVLAGLGGLVFSESGTATKVPGSNGASAGDPLATLEARRVGAEGTGDHLAGPSRVPWVGPRCRFEVVASDGVALPDATVLSWTDGQEAEEIPVDGLGVVDFGAPSVAGGVLVSAPLCVTRLVRVEDWTKLTRVALETSRPVTGWVLVDGEPESGVEMKLSTTSSGPSFEVPESISGLLAGAPRTSVSDAQGRFRFEGLARDWRGRVEVARGYSILRASHGSMDSGSQQRTLLLEAPCDGLGLEAGRWPVLRGRLVWADSGEGVAEGGLNVYVEFASGMTSPMTGANSDDRGNFSVALGTSSASDLHAWVDPARRGRPSRISLGAWADGSAGFVSRDWNDEELEESLERLDLEVSLERARVWHFVARDGASGEPVAGARVSAPGGVGGPADAEGRGTFLGGEAPFLIGSPTHQIEPLEPLEVADGTAADPLEFALHPANLLTVAVVAAPAVLEHLSSVRLQTAGEGLFLEGRPSSTQLHEAFGFPVFYGSIGKDEARYGAAPDPHGRVEVHCLRPGVSMQIAVIDRLGRTMAEAAAVSPALGERLEVRLEVEATPVEFRGIVVDAVGEPVADASVSVNRHMRQPTDVEGRFTLSGFLDAPDGTLMIEHPAYVPQVHESFRPKPDDPERRFVLMEGRTVEVALVDPEGVPVLGIRPGVDLEMPGAGRWLELGDGRHRFGALPAGLVTFYCIVAGQRVEWRHDTRLPDARLELPARPVELVISPPEGWMAPDEGRESVLVTPLDAAGGESFSLAYRLPEERSRQLLVLPGRYRIQRRWRHEKTDQRPAWYEDLGTPREITVVPGGPNLIRLH